MNKLVFSLLISSSSLALFTGCGDDDDDEGTGSKPSAAEFASGEACAEEGAGAPADCDTTEYGECLQMQCEAEYKDCLGNGYASGNFAGGRCKEMMDCAMAAPDPCTADCAPSDDCTSCMLEIANCSFGSSCELPECAGGGGSTPSGSTGSGGGCAALDECCASMTGDQQDQCTQQADAVRAGGDAVCDAALSIYQASGTCP
jgi:hypothetical protein